MRRNTTRSASRFRHWGSHWGGGGEGSKNRKTATKCAKNRKTVSKIVENRNRNVYVALYSCMQGMGYKATEKPWTTSANRKPPMIRTKNRKPWCCRKPQNRASKPQTPMSPATLYLRQNLICPPARRLYLKELLNILQTVSSCSRYTTFFRFGSRFHRQNLPIPKRSPLRFTH